MPSNGSFKVAGQVLSWPDGHIPTVRRLIREYDQQRQAPVSTNSSQAQGFRYQSTQFVSTGAPAFEVRPQVSQVYALPAIGYASSYMPMMSYRPTAMMGGYRSGYSGSYSSGRRMFSYRSARACGPGG